VESADSVRLREADPSPRLAEEGSDVDGVQGLSGGASFEARGGSKGGDMTFLLTFLGVWFALSIATALAWVLFAGFPSSSWDKEVKRSDRPIDLTGWRR
jgi:hypothetical protein